MNNISSTFVRIASFSHAHTDADALGLKKNLLEQAILNKDGITVKKAILALQQEDNYSLSMLKVVQDALMAPEHDGFLLEIKKILVEVLLKQDGFDINAPIAQGETLLDAAIHNDPEFGDFLREKGAVLPEKLAKIDSKNTVNINTIRFASGLLSGVTVAGLMPWGRVVFKSVYENQPFLPALNFNNLYRGFSQFIVTKALSSGLYFPFYEVFYAELKPVTDNETLRAALSGYAAGVCSSMPLNGLTAIKYQCLHNKNTFFKTFKTMWRCGGVAPFLYGAGPTILRDAVFGGVYGPLQHYAKNSWVAHDLSDTSFCEHIGNIASGCAASIVASPLHYARNCALATSPDSPAPSIYASLRNLFQQAAASPHPVKTAIRSLNIGPGTLRAGVGIWAGSVFYDGYKYQFLNCKFKL